MIKHNFLMAALWGLLIALLILQFNINASRFSEIMNNQQKIIENHSLILKAVDEDIDIGKKILDIWQQDIGKSR